MRAGVCLWHIMETRIGVVQSFLLLLLLILTEVQLDLTWKQLFAEGIHLFNSL